MSTDPSDAKKGISRRQMLKYMGLTLAGGSLAACAPAVAETAAPATGVPQATAIPPTVEFTKAPPVEVRFWNVWGAAREEMVNKMVTDFNAQHPEIQAVNVLQSNERYAENIITALNSNDPPEVIMVARSVLLKLAADGVILPMDDLIKKYEIDLSKYFASEIGNFQWNNKQYSLPMPTGGGSTSLMLINEDLFAQEGITPTLPKTWKELEEVAKEFTVFDNKGIVQLGTNVGVDVSAFFAWLYCNNSTIYSDDLKSTNFASPEGIETLEWMAKFTKEINHSVEDVLSFLPIAGEAQESHPWYNNKQAIHFENVSIFVAMNTYSPDMKWDLGLRPYNGDNPNAKSQGLGGEQYAWGYVIPTKIAPERQEAAFQWIKRICYDDEGACWFMKQQSRPSPLIACNNDPAYLELNPKWDKVLKSLASDVTLKIFPDHARVRDIVDQAVQATMFGNSTAKDALTDAAKQAQAVIDDFWKAYS